MRPVGEVFPVGGPVPRDRMVGREEAIADIAMRLREQMSVTLVGPRRIGKTSVGNAVCDELAATHVVVRIEVPEGPDSQQLRHRMIAGCEGQSLRDEGRRAANALLPALKDALKSQGLPMDLEQIEGLDPQSAPWRAILELPIMVARAKRKPLVLFLDELQRVVDYTDAGEILADLVDLYGAITPDASVLVDGSEERAIEDLLGKPHHLAKIAPSRALATRIPLPAWRSVVPVRFAELGLAIESRMVDRILAPFDGQPFVTAAAFQGAAFAARRAGAASVGDLEVAYGIAYGRRREAEDDA